MNSTSYARPSLYMHDGSDKAVLRDIALQDWDPHKERLNWRDARDQLNSAILC
jgi:hypothetical protein